MLSCESAHRILIVDGDLAAVAPLRDRLIQRNFEVVLKTDGALAVKAIASRPPNLLILDWGLTGTSAAEIIRAASRNDQARHARIMLLSTSTLERDIVAGFEHGADDFVAKPFSLHEVVARVGVLLRRRPSAARKIFAGFDGLEIDASTHQVLAAGRPLELRAAEYRLLEFLICHAGRTFDRSRLMTQVWGERSTVDLRTVDVNVQRLRRILSRAGYENRIQTVRGFGYRFADD
jgi:two-component system, OmpR family, phosphate regulon response regulator PhoB